MPTSDARVTTLTATVRTLYIRRRQVTLSIAKQLDTVKPDRMVEPFGRLSSSVFAQRLSGWRTDKKAIWVIGSDIEGNLAISWCAQWKEQYTSRHPFDDHNVDAETYGEWLNLPLIVLAGLR